jgi:hypothetical protein
MVQLVLSPSLLIVTLIAMAPLPPLMHRHLCHHHHCNCQPHDDGVIVVVNAQVSFLSSSWHHCPCNNGVFALDLQQHGSPCCNVGIVSLVAMVSLSSSMCKHPCRHHNGVVALIAMVFLPLMHRHLCHCCGGHCHPRCNGISAVVKLAQSSSWCCCPCDNGVVAVIDTQASLLSLRLHHCPHCNGVAIVNEQAFLQSRNFLPMLR